MKLLLTAALVVLSSAAYADRLITIPTTADISVSDSATSETNLSQRADWLVIKNDCSVDLYFGLSESLTQPTASTQYNIRLKQGESFSGAFRVTTIGVSPAALASSCTYTLHAGRQG